MNSNLTFLLALLLSLVACASAAAEPVNAVNAVNAVIGDDSWYALQTGAPTGAGETERIRTHLAWVGSLLSNADTSHLSADVAQRRAAMLRELALYRAAGEFPRHELTGEGREPRWVDHEGRACAVGHLVAASGHKDLFDEVAADHEYDYVPDIDVPDLLDWADRYGFTARELAMIQPTYRNRPGVSVPNPHEERFLREEEERRRKVPRPLTEQHVESVISGNISVREVKRACLKQETGAWTIKTTTKVGKKVKAKIKAVVTKAGATVAAETTKCFERELAKRLQESLELVNYTVEAPIVVAQVSSIEIPTDDQIEAAFLKREAYVRHFGSVPAALAKCFQESAVSGDFAIIPLRVSSWNGRVVLRWPEITRAKDQEYRRFGFCLQHVLNYGDVESHGIWDHEFSVRIDADGSMKVVPSG